MSFKSPMDIRVSLRIAGVLILAIVILIVGVMKKDALPPDSSLEGTQTVSLDDKDFEVEEYIYEDEDSNKTYLLVVTNHSGYTVNFDCNTTAYEEDGSYIGINYNRINAIEPENSGCMVFDFDNGYAQRFKYELYYEVSKTNSGMRDVSTEDSMSGMTVTATCTNNGEIAVDYLRADVLYFSGDELVGYDFSYLYEENSSRIEAGESLSHDFECDMEFDNYKVYYSCQNAQ